VPEIASKSDSEDASRKPDEMLPVIVEREIFPPSPPTTSPAIGDAEESDFEYALRV
jgi:hypothetical protein